MVWRPESSADLVKNFMETYTPFDKVGGFVSAGVMASYKDEVVSRLSVKPEK